MDEFTAVQIETFKAAPPERLYRMFVAMFPPEFAAQLDVLLLKGMRPEAVFALPSASDIPPVIKEVTIKALEWRRERLIEGAGLN